MARKRPSKRAKPAKPAASPTRAARPSALLDTRIIYCGDCLDPTEPRPSGSGSFPPDACVGLIYIDPPFNSNRNYEVFWGETKEKRGSKDKLAPQDPNDEPASVLLDRIRAKRDANCMRTAGTAVRPRRKSRSNSRG